MKLMELFSPTEKEIKKYDPEVDYLDDLKFWISNNDDLVSKVLMPAIKKQKSNPADENTYRYYVKPLEKCCDIYCKQFDLTDSQKEIFGSDEIVRLAKRISQEQKNYIDKGDYHETK